MHALDPLCSAAGTWRATYQLRDPANNLSSDSESRATVTPILGGRFSAPPGPDWGWRTEIRATAARLQIVMFNVDPDSRETLAVTADYARLS